MINVRVTQRVSIEENHSIRTAVEETELQLKGRGRVLLRPSGTEPVIRVMVEGEELSTVETLARQLAQHVERAIG